MNPAKWVEIFLKKKLVADAVFWQSLFTAENKAAFTMTLFEKIKLALADAKGRFVGFEFHAKPLDSKMNKKGNPFYGLGFSYVSRLTVRAGVEYAKLATSPDDVSAAPSWATREVDSNGIVSYRKNSDGRKVYLGVAPVSGSKTIFAPDGSEATAEQLAELKPFLKKSGEPTWLTIGIDSIAKATINGVEHAETI